MNQFSVNGTVCAGLAKLVEECGEVCQVAGKIMQVGGYAHWQGDLRAKLVEELADLEAAIVFLGEVNDLNSPEYRERVEIKLALFRKWRAEQVQG